MNIINLIQGSPEWLDHRAKHFNASDAPAMLGLSKYKTRSQLLHEMHTGSVPEVDAGTQQRFNDGHRFEALARPFAEEIIGEELSPMVGSEEKFSASFDGITFGRSVIFEHKTLNDELRAAEFVDGGYYLPAQYRAQMEQQLMVSGATKCLFMASKFDGNDNLIEELHCWYESDQVMRGNIMQGWTQFAIDLAAYVPPEVTEKAVAAPFMQLPALFIQVEGSFNLTTNLDAFGSALKEFVAKIELKPTDDQGFADLDAQVKCLKEAEALIKAQKLGAQGQVVTFDLMCKAADMLLDIASKARIAGENAVKSQKVAIKDKAIADAKALFAAHVAGLEAEIAPIRMVVVQPDFIAATKGLKGLKSLHNEIDTALANGKITADAAAKDVRTKLAWYSKKIVGSAGSYAFMFPDLQQVIQKPIDDFMLLVTTRIETHKQAEIERQEAWSAAQKTIDEAAAKAMAGQEAIAEQARKEEAAKHVTQHDQASAIEDARKRAQLAESAKMQGLKQARPSNKQIVESIAAQFDVSYGTACDWIMEIAEAMRQAA